MICATGLDLDLDGLRFRVNVVMGTHLVEHGNFVENVGHGYFLSRNMILCGTWQILLELLDMAN